MSVSHAGRDQGWAEWIAWQLVRADVAVELACWDWQAGDDVGGVVDVAIRPRARPAAPA
ncbi:TIR domain-containing protein [Pseudonocardia humida]|uniref:TIR domain-containing protein n=1 Tax=Pseudonocardia humida TaxID=2800819 RepID=A0ABT0ZY34_9PSEU|nr:TIR domain-containing protein [Pseudonocardia humida]MCO1655580.1 TIR domain-containing protein [Pseudonocardia humida]